MPFKVFRRHQRTLLAMLAIMAMFAFVVADSLPRLFSNYATPAGGDRVVVELGGKDVRQSELERLRLQRGRANYVLSRLLMMDPDRGQPAILFLSGQPSLAPYFDQQTFGPTDDAAMVDALLLEQKADELDLPGTAELAKAWIFEQARVQHELYRSVQPSLPGFNPVDLAAQLQAVFNQAFGREMTEAAFLTDVASQVRILQALELLSQPTVTPLDTYKVYSDRQVEVEARYVSLPVSDFLDEVDEPEESELRDFFEEHKDRTPDPSTGTVGFRAPRRAKVEFLTLGLNAIDVIREQVRSEPLAQEVREVPGFEEQVLDAYTQVLQAREQDPETRPIPVNPFKDPEGDEGIALSYPAEFERQYVDEQVDALVQERTRQRIQDLFDPVRRAMNDYSFGFEDLEAIRTGLEAQVSRDELPDLDEELRTSPVGQELIEALGIAARSDEGVRFVRIGLTPKLAEPGTFEELTGPEGIPLAWQDYLALARLEWADASYALLRSVQRITEAVEGIDRPELINPVENETFAEVMFDPNTPMFEPREFTDAEGRRYLAWKTLDLPELTRSFEETPEGVVASTWRLEQARDKAREAAEALASEVREQAGEEVISPASALEQVALEQGLTPGSTGARRRVDTLATFRPIDAGEELRDAIFRLSDRGEDAALVAPDRGKDTYYVFTLSRRSDTSAGGSIAGEGTELDYSNALTSLQYFRRDADQEATVSREEAVMAYLRQEAEMEPDWTPPTGNRY